MYKQEKGKTLLVRLQQANNENEDFIQPTSMVLFFCYSSVFFLMSKLQKVAQIIKISIRDNLNYIPYMP